MGFQTHFTYSTYVFIGHQLPNRDNNDVAGKLILERGVSGLVKYKETVW